MPHPNHYVLALNLMTHRYIVASTHSTPQDACDALHKAAMEYGTENVFLVSTENQAASSNNAINEESSNEILGLQEQSNDTSITRKPRKLDKRRLAPPRSRVSFTLFGAAREQFEQYAESRGVSFPNAAEQIIRAAMDLGVSFVAEFIVPASSRARRRDGRGRHFVLDIEDTLIDQLDALSSARRASYTVRLRACLLALEHANRNV